MHIDRTRITPEQLKDNIKQSASEAAIATGDIDTSFVSPFVCSRWCRPPDGLFRQMVCLVGSFVSPFFLSPGRLVDSTRQNLSS